tara:strand:+ start:577 stop:798 length:222 start_codon:yes stop_codon:yes gene_type:complete
MKRHPMNEKLTDCTLCNAENSLNRVPSSVMMKKGHDLVPPKTGEAVKSAIEEGRQQLKNEKERLKNNVFEIEK